MQIKLFEAQATNEHLLKEDEKILELLFNLDDEKSEDEESENEVTSFDEKKDYKLAKALKEILLTLSSSDIESVFHVQLLIKLSISHI